MKVSRKKSRQLRIRAKTKGTEAKPRLTVFRSNKFFYAQIIDDSKGQTVIGISEKSLKLKEGIRKMEKAKELGIILAKKALDKKIKKIVFDKGSYRYHGKVKAFADGVREGGLEF